MELVGGVVSSNSPTGDSVDDADVAVGIFVYGEGYADQWRILADLSLVCKGGEGSFCSPSTLEAAAFASGSRLYSPSASFLAGSVDLSQSRLGTNGMSEMDMKYRALLQPQMRTGYRIPNHLSDVIGTHQVQETRWVIPHPRTNYSLHQSCPRWANVCDDDWNMVPGDRHLKSEAEV